jgi:predicted KAP-like P-loop ATPase
MKLLDKLLGRNPFKALDHPPEPDLESVTAAALTNGVAGDSPISSPTQDLFDIDPFAKALAASIARVDAKDGLVFAINGAWGTGKSSAVNLVTHHLEQELVDDDILIVTFNPWWFSDSEALTISFFQELHASVGKSLSESARNAMASLGSRLSTAGPLLGGIASLLATPATGAAVTGAASVIERFTKLDSTVQQEHQKLVKALASQTKRFLIVIDDIDRLSTDDALQVFKLIKSVGRLPNVVYLLAFDRQLAEKMISERFPAEGTSYLDKIVQGAFDIPLPDKEELQSQILQVVQDTMGPPIEPKMVRFMNIFYDAVAPFLRTPRDVVRLSNAIRVSWPAVSAEADRADYLALETIRIFLPEMYRQVRSFPDLLTDIQPSGQKADVAHYDRIFLGELKGSEREIAKRALRRLFPRLDGVWGNFFYSDTIPWQRDRLVCSSPNFKTYFNFGAIGDGLSSTESHALIASAGIPGATASALRDYAATTRKRRGTRAALALDELSIRAGDVADNNVGQLIKDLFSVADYIDLAADEARGFSLRSNQLRIHWIMNSLLERFDINRRTTLVEDAAQTSSLSWLMSYADRCKDKNDDAVEGKISEGLIESAACDRLTALAVDRIRQAASDGSLARMRDLVPALFWWRRQTTESEVLPWANAQMMNDEFLVHFADVAVQEIYSQSMGFGDLGDRVSRRRDYVPLESLRGVIDTDTLQTRINDLCQSSEISDDQRIVLKRFTDAPKNER